jgi:hypothetical protein
MTDIAATAYRQISPRARALGFGDPGALQNVITDPLPDGAECYVTSIRATFRLDKGSAAAAQGEYVIPPVGGPGRWIRQDGALYAVNATELTALLSLPGAAETTVLTLSFSNVPAGRSLIVEGYASLLQVGAGTIGIKIATRENGTGAFVDVPRSLFNSNVIERVTLKTLTYTDPFPAALSQLEVRMIFVNGSASAQTLDPTASPAANALLWAAIAAPLEKA